MNPSSRGREAVGEARVLTADRRLRGDEPFGAAPSLRRRQLRLTAATVAVIVTSAAVFGWLWTRAAQRRPVLAVAETVLAGEVIQAGDLAVTRVSVDALLAPIPAGERSRVVGLTAAADLAAGTLLTEAQLGEPLLIGAGEAVVGMALEPGRTPNARLRAGDRVWVIATAPPAGAASVRTGAGFGEASEVLAVARVLAVDGYADAAGERLVSLIVDQADAPGVAAAAADDRVSLVLVAGR